MLMANYKYAPVYSAQWDRYRFRIIDYYVLCKRKKRERKYETVHIPNIPYCPLPFSRRNKTALIIAGDSESYLQTRVE